MTKGATSGPLLSLMLDTTASTPLYRQLYEQLRQAILSGNLPPGTRLPATRVFARNHGISRNTVLIAFEQLLYEGYLRGKVGSGTYVEDVLPDDMLQPHPPAQAPLDDAKKPAREQTGPHLSIRGQQTTATPVAPVTNWEQMETLQAFRPGMPALNEFPFKLWSKLSARRWRDVTTNSTLSGLFGYTDPAGYRPLRREIAAYVQAARGVRCSEEQVIIVSGSQQAIILAAHLLTDPGDALWIEDPCYMGALSALSGSGVRLVPIPVDQEGLDVAQGIAQAPQARMAYVTPSHQFPSGVTMSLARRLALLQWAQRSAAWILEDDYDGEYRYAGRPLASLQGLDTANRVIYIGTFSKVLFPALRLGYIIAPPELVEAFISARATFDRNSPIHEQLVLADFMGEEHFVRHIRRMRALYEERQHFLLRTLRERLPEQFQVASHEAGMHIVAHLNPERTQNQPDTEISRRAADAGVMVNPISRYYIRQQPQNALVIGFAAYDEVCMKDGVERLARIFT